MDKVRSQTRRPRSPATCSGPIDLHDDNFCIETTESFQWKRPPQSSLDTKPTRLENKSMYKKGGYHPIELNDYLHQRYVVMHKLGYGTSSTVWLCWDNDDRTLVAVKVLTADKSSESSPELVVKRHFRRKCRTELEFNHIFIPLEHFWIDGPNGRHLCFVTQLLGPPLSRVIPGLGIDVPELLKDLCYQASMSLCYLHRKGVCHGDFRPEKFMMQLDYKAMSGRNIQKYLGPIITHPFEQSPSTNAHTQGENPSCLVEPADLTLLESTFRTGVIAITGFGQASLAQGQSRLQRFDLRYAAPETLITRKRDGHASDMWSLACTIYSIRTQGQLLGPVDSFHNLLGFLGWAFGPITSPLRDGVDDLLPHGSIIRDVDEKDKFELRTRTDKQHSKPTDRHYLPRSWVEYRRELSAILSAHDLVDESSHSNVIATLLPKDWRKWRKVRQQRERHTGYPTLLHEDLSRERVIYEKSSSILELEIPGSSEDEDQQEEGGESDPPTPTGAWSPPGTPLSEWDPIEDIRESEDKEYQGAFTQEELRLLDEMDRDSTARAIESRAERLHEWEDRYRPRKARLKEGVREQIDGLDLQVDIIERFTPEHGRVQRKLMDLVRDKRRAKKAARAAAQIGQQNEKKEGPESKSGRKEEVVNEEIPEDSSISRQENEEKELEELAVPIVKTPLEDGYDLQEQHLVVMPDEIGSTIDLEKPPSPAELLIRDATDPPGIQGVRHRGEQHEILSEDDNEETTPRDVTWPKDIDSMRYSTRQQVSDEVAAGVKRPLAEIDWEQWTSDRKRPRMEFSIERTLCDQVESVEQPSGWKKTTYRLQKGEVDLLADLLNKMLKNNPRDRIGFPEVLKHKWFGDRWKCMVGSIHALHAARNWPG